MNKNNINEDIKILEFSKDEFYKHYDLNNNDTIRKFLENEIKFLGFPILDNIITLILEVDNKIAGVCQLSKLDGSQKKRLH